MTDSRYSENTRRARKRSVRGASRHKRRGKHEQRVSQGRRRERESVPRVRETEQVRGGMRRQGHRE